MTQSDCSMYSGDRVNPQDEIPMMGTANATGRLYKTASLIFLGIGIFYIGAIIDTWMSLRASPTTTNVFYYLGATRVSGWLATGILATQIGLMWKYRPTRVWSVLGFVVCMICSLAILNWIGNL